jgi:hypothetical protein|tara:strand:- start:35 stop:949 length:915 start_codon:yes stop_codon:yes gene_type:complete
MAVISRSQLVKELEPGLHALFGLEYKRWEREHAEIFTEETSDRAFEEETLLTGFGAAPTKSEGSSVEFDTAAEQWTARYVHETIALAFAITEEAVEDNLYDTLSKRYTAALARSMAYTKQVKAANVLNNAFNSSFKGGDGKELCATDHPTLMAGTQSNEPSTAADLSESSLENAIIQIGGFADDRDIPVAVQARKLVIPKDLAFTAQRILKSDLRVGTADNDTNALRTMGMLPEGYVVNHYLTDTDAFFILTDLTNTGLKMFQRRPLKTSMEPDFETGNMRFKASERYSFGFSDWRCIFGSPGA